MTLLDNLHQAHKERMSRMGGNSFLDPAPAPQAVPPIYPTTADRLAKLTEDFNAMLGEVAALKQQQQIHTALIGKLITTESDEKPSFGEIIDSVCEFYKVTRNDVMSARRTADLTMPRMIICFLGRSLTGMSFPQMGRRLGGRDHTTALHGANKIHRQIEADATLRDDIDVLELKIGAKVMERRFGTNVRPLA